MTQLRSQSGKFQSGKPHYTQSEGPASSQWLPPNGLLFSQWHLASDSPDGPGA